MKCIKFNNEIADKQLEMLWSNTKNADDCYYTLQDIKNI